MAEKSVLAGFFLCYIESMISSIYLIGKECLHARELQYGFRLVALKPKTPVQKTASTSFLWMAALWFVLFALWISGLVLPFVFFDDALHRIGIPITMTLSYAALVLCVKYTIGRPWKAYLRANDPLLPAKNRKPRT